MALLTVDIMELFFGCPATGKLNGVDNFLVKSFTMELF